MDIKEFRHKYPEYDKASDKALATAVHEKYYSRVPFAKFAGAFGYLPEVEPPPALPEETIPQKIDRFAQENLPQPTGNETAEPMPGFGGEEAQFPEDDFQSWYKDMSKITGNDPNPDDPRHKYDYRAAFEAGAEPVQGEDGGYHWPSEFKADDHPNRFVDGIDTKTGKPPGEPTFLQDTLKSFKNVGAGAAGALNRGLGVFAHGLDKLTDYVAEKYGVEKGGLFAAAEKQYAKNAEYWDAKLQDPSLVEEITAEFLGGAAPGMAEFMLGVPYAALQGSVEGGAKGAIAEGGKRALMGQILHAANSMKLFPRTAAMGVVGGVEAAAAGGDAREIAKGAGVMAGFGATAGSRGKSLKDIYAKETRPAYTDIIDKTIPLDKTFATETDRRIKSMTEWNQAKIDPWKKKYDVNKYDKAVEKVKDFGGIPGPKEVDAFVDRMVDGQAMDSKTDLEFYQNNAELIEQTLVKRIEEREWENKPVQPLIDVKAREKENAAEITETAPVNEETPAQAAEVKGVEGEVVPEVSPEAAAKVKTLSERVEEVKAKNVSGVKVSKRFTLESGERVTAKKDVSKLLRDVDKKREAYKKLLDCL